MQDDSRGRLVAFISNPLFIGLFFSLYSIFGRFYLYPKYSELLAEDFELIKSFIEWFGVAYGLLIALVLVNVWAQFDGTEREFDREADAIFMLYESVKQVQETAGTRDLGEKIIEAIKKYVAHVTDNYKVELHNLKARDVGDKVLEDIRVLIGRLIYTDAPEAITFELVRQFNEVADVRGDRISRSRQRIPKPVWSISVASSILWVIPFYGLKFASDWVAIFLMSGVTAVVIAILVIIRDLDDPFEGSWQIDIEEWEQLGEKIELKPTLYFVYNMDSRPIISIRAHIQKLVAKPPCALYELLHTRCPPPHKHRRSATVAPGNKQSSGKHFIYHHLAKRAYCRATYSDEYEKLYEKLNSLPAIVCKAKNQTSFMIKAEEIQNLATPLELLKKMRKKLTAVGT